jgi:hemoglobin-like flavoprotein
MTPEQVTLVLDGIDRLQPRMLETADAFYRRLFERHPELRFMFPDDLTRLRSKFADELRTIVRAIPDFGAFVTQAGHLGARHVGYGVRVAHYAIVRVALLEAVAAQLGPEWTDEAAAAWAAAYDIITEAMLMGTSMGNVAARN